MKLKTDNNSYLEADPTTYHTILRPDDNLRLVEGNRYLCTSTGETFYKLRDELPLQQFIVWLALGYFNVSHIISRNGEYFSKKLDLSKIVQNLDLRDVKTDIWLFSLVFGDFDHGLEEGCPDFNLIFEDDFRQYAFYDFGNANFFSFDSEEEIAPKNLNDINFDRAKIKIEELLEFYDNQTGKSFFMNIYKKSSFSKYRESVREKFRSRFPDVLLDKLDKKVLDEVSKKETNEESITEMFLWLVKREQKHSQLTDEEFYSSWIGKIKEIKNYIDAQVL